jgi:hypothetical protein
MIRSRERLDSIDASTTKNDMATRRESSNLETRILAPKWSYNSYLRTGQRSDFL